MFRRLRNHLIVFNLIVTTTIVVVTFATIYMFVSGATAERSVPISNPEFYSTSFLQTLEERMRLEREASLQSLLRALITTGLLMEIAVAIFSYVWANEAVRPIKKAYDAQKTFIANASHEIKTPLAAIEANLEAADIENNRWIDNVRTEVRAISTLNQSLLALTRADSVSAEKPSVINLRSTIERLVAPFEPRLKAKKVQIDINPKTKLTVSAPDLEQLLTILIDNAIKYSAKHIWIKYFNQTIIVENDGATISAGDLPRIFDRFYQSDKSAEGVGLGLAIAQSLAKRNHWTLTASSGKLTTFRLKL